MARHRVDRVKGERENLGLGVNLGSGPLVQFVKLQALHVILGWKSFCKWWCKSVVMVLQNGGVG